MHSEHVGITGLKLPSIIMSPLWMATEDLMISMIGRVVCSSSTGKLPLTLLEKMQWVAASRIAFLISGSLVEPANVSNV